MKINSPSLYIEINKFEFIFIVVDKIDNDDCKIAHINSVPIQGITEHQISDIELIFDVLQKNILMIEQKINFIFKEVILIIDNFECSLINFSGFKKLNGSQLVKENITYLLNSLKAKINEIEKDKTILHIFNSNHFLDKKKIDNLPIGLFGNFYSHELSFFLIKNNDLKNLKNVLNKCNLKIKKIISKNFIEGANLISEKENLNTFFKIEINDQNSKIFFFENSSLKFFQNFPFGSNIILNDISKITGLKYENVKKLLTNCNLSEESLDNEIVEEEYFQGHNYRKIKKKLITDIANARIQELSEIMMIKNININSFLKNKAQVFLKINNQLSFKNFKEFYKYSFSQENAIELLFLDQNSFKNIYQNTSKIVQYGWKKEAVPFIQEKKSLITRFFDLFFN